MRFANSVNKMRFVYTVNKVSFQFREQSWRLHPIPDTGLASLRNKSFYFTIIDREFRYDVSLTYNIYLKAGMRVKKEVSILTGALSSHNRYISVTSSLNINLSNRNLNKLSLDSSNLHLVILSVVTSNVAKWPTHNSEPELD